MFGYVQPDKPELKMREYNHFRSYYCGLCKALGKRSGQLSRFTLNYDLTFLVLLLNGALGFEEKWDSEGCIANPFKKKMILKENPILDYVSDINVLMAYYKMVDDWADDRKITAAGGKCLFFRQVERIKKIYPDKVSVIENNLARLRKLENENSDSLDMVSDCFAKVMEEVIDPPDLIVNMAFRQNDGISEESREIQSTAENTRKALRWIGYNLGKWIYIMDAYDDLEKDIVKKRYNVLIYRFKKEENEDLEEFRIRINERVRFLLTHCLAQIGNGFELLRMKSNYSIVHNIIYSGMSKKMDHILLKGSGEHLEKPL